MRLALTVTLLLVVPASASLLEDHGVAYQFDGDTHHDAPDACQEADPQWQLRPGNSTDGMLVPVDDESDFFVFNTTAEDVGKRFTISLDEASTVIADFRARLDVLGPSCTSVLDAMPLMAAAGEKVVSSPNVHNEDMKCTSRWFFVVNQVDLSTAPDFIRLTWEDGLVQDVPMDPVPPNPVGQYQTPGRNGIPVRSAEAIVPDNWTGEFRLGERPCGAHPVEPAMATASGAEFTLVAGQYIIAVHLEEVEPRDPTEPVVVPVNCHTACLAPVEPLFENLSYNLFSEEAHD